MKRPDSPSTPARPPRPSRRAKSCPVAPDVRDIEPPEAREAITDEGCGRLVEAPQPSAPADYEPQPKEALSVRPPREAEAEEHDEPAHDEPANDTKASAQRPPRNPDLPFVRILTTAEIFAPQPPTNWLVRELQLAPGRPALLYGAAGAGKSVIVQSLALFIAAGSPAWGQFSTRPGRVLHVDYDQGDEATRKRYKRIAVGCGLELEALGDRLRLMPFPPVSLSNPGKAERFFTEHCRGVDLCVIDSLRKAIPNMDENDSRVGANLAICARVSEKTGTVFLVLHHQGKPRDGESDASMSPRGSSALLASAGAALLVTGGRGKPKRVRAMRDSESFEGGEPLDFVLCFEDLPKSGDLAPLRVAYEGAPQPDGAADLRSELDGRILDFVRANPGCGITAVRSAVGANNTLVRQRIEALEEKGALRRTTNGRNVVLHVSEPPDEQGEGLDG